MGIVANAYYNNQWINATALTAASGGSINATYAIEWQEGSDAVRVKTAVDWLRERVGEVTSLAFAEVPA